MEDEQEQREAAPAAPAPDAVYANNAQVEISFWDLKILFGQIEQHTGKTNIDVHTAVTMPWAQAKLLSYFLRLQVAWYEAQNGPINLLTSLIPTKLELLETQEEGEGQAPPSIIEFYELAARLHDEMFGDRK